MAIKQLEQALKLILKMPPRPHYYRMMKGYIDVMFYNFNWETMKHKDRKKAISMIYHALDKFNELKTWQPDTKEWTPTTRLPKIKEETNKPTESIGNDPDVGEHE